MYITSDTDNQPASREYQSGIRSTTLIPFIANQYIINPNGSPTIAEASSGRVIIATQNST